MRAFNLRGTNGSGKTYVAKALLVETNARVVQMTKPTGRGKPKALVYEGKYMGRPIYFFGSYEQYCGGCDTIPSVKIVADLLGHALMKKQVGLVFYEGLMISHMLGTVGLVAHNFNSQHVMGFLDTPLETCIARVRSRRIERGEHKPFDPHRSLIPDYQRVQAAKQNAIKGDFRVTTIEHGRAVAHVKEWLHMLIQEQMP